MSRDRRHAVVDLTGNDDNSDDSDEGPLASLPLATGPPTTTQHGALSTGSQLPNPPRHVPTMTRPGAYSHLPFPQSAPYTSPATPQYIHHQGTPQIGLSGSFDMAAMGRSGANNYAQIPGHVYTGTNGSAYAERAPKRMRIADTAIASTFSTPSVPVPIQQAPTMPQNGTPILPPFRTLTHNDPTPWNPGAQGRPPSATGSASSRLSYFAGPTQGPRDDDNDSVMSDISEPVSKRPAKIGHTTPHLSSTPAQSTMLAKPQPTPAPRRRNFTYQFDMAQDHFLIFLKEVKQYKWSVITAEFNKYMPARQYSTLQSRYSTTLNKRDRSQDPTTLLLPPQFAAEANIDWTRVHPSNVSFKPLRRLLQSTTPQPQAAQNPQRLSWRPPVQQTEHDYSSGTDSAPRRERTRRAQRVNYTWPKQRGVGDEISDNVSGVAVQDTHSSDDVFVKSETSQEEDEPLPSKAVAVDNDPVDVDFDVEDARLGLSLRQKGLRDTPVKVVPYLSALQRSSMQHPLVLDWDQLSSRDWQGQVFHVDFSPVELRIVEKVVVSMKKPSRSRHGTLKRQLRENLRGLNEPKILRLVNKLQRQLPCRDRCSIEAFVQDAIEGTIAEEPRVKRLAAARPDIAMSSIEKPSTISIIRERELGHQSRRGWQAASKPLTYQVKNKLMDTMGPASCWTGASSDIHTLAWAPDGEHFAAGAVAVDDPDSMQYNRPNNLLFGDTTHGMIHELAEHYKKREKTESGANSSHAMFASQDPKLYTTVSSVAFSTTGRFMYSAGYDKHIGIWHTDTESIQPILGAKLNVKDQIDILSVNRTHEGVLATAARSFNEKAIRLLRINEEDPSRFDKWSFHSNKAVSRIDLKILPTALQFEPKYGSLLLAGFGANTRESAFDTTGDLCLWDVETQNPLHIHGSSKNIFDVEFNPSRTSLPLFAVGCVAGANANRGTRSLIRLYDVNGPDKFTCPLEFECKALDMNDVVWCPHDEHLIAAGCTDGRVYIWDIRWPDDPLRILSHGQSLMPLQEGVKHEITDTGVRFLSWGENATRLYSGSSDGVVKVWDVTRAEENTFIKDLITTDSGIMSGAFSADYSKLLLGEVNGSVNVLEVGRDDTSLKDAEKLRYMPYQDDEQGDVTEDMARPAPDSGIAEANHFLETDQIQIVPMGSLPISQAIQGRNYAGPFDQSSDAPFLRTQAQIFQQSLIVPPGPQCNIPTCKETAPTITSEEIGDSGRSLDRVPDELRRQWKTDVSTLRLVPGKAKCTSCGRPARPLVGDDVDARDKQSALCERCSFSCFRCGASNALEPATTTLSCATCGGVWDIGALGYECVREPHAKTTRIHNVPSLRRWGREVYEEFLEEAETGYGDEENALSEWFLGLGI